MPIYEGSFSEVMIKIILTEQLVLYVFLLILSILKDVHAKKPVEDKPEREENPVVTNISEPPSSKALPEYRNEEITSKAIYLKKKSTISVKSDNKYDFSSDPSMIGSMKVQSETRCREIEAMKKGGQKGEGIQVFDERRFMTRDAIFEGETKLGVLDFTKKQNGKYLFIKGGFVGIQINGF